MNFVQQDDEVIQYTPEVSDIDDLQHQSYYSYGFLGGGLQPPPKKENRLGLCPRPRLRMCVQKHFYKTINAILSGDESSKSRQSLKVP